MKTFTRLIRFLSSDGAIYHGNAILPDGVADIARAKQARIVHGDIFATHSVSDKIARNQIPTVRCLGTNYAQHAQEAGLPIPKYPVLFYKPVTAVSGPCDAIPVPSLAQIDGLDFECELVIVMGKECRDVDEINALDHVLGYTVGNDVSHREWQLHRGGSQWSLGKGFDGWAPIGPGIVHKNSVPDPQELILSTTVNGKQMQHNSTKDMIFSIKSIISFLSQGTTLLPGDLIFTGTPQGVGMGRRPVQWLHHGDLVETSIDMIGSCQNQIRWDKKYMVNDEC